MLIKVRFGVFETNSSSVHTLTICSTKEFEDFKKGKMVMYWNKLLTKQELKKKYEEDKSGITFEEWIDEEVEDGELYMDYEQYQDKNDWYEHYDEKHTVNGTEIIAFGYSGYNG